MSRLTLVLLPNTTRYMLTHVRTRLNAERPSAPLVFSSLSCFHDVPHAKVVPVTKNCHQLVLDLKPTLVIVDVVPHTDPIYYYLKNAATQVNAELWCIMYDAVPGVQPLLEAHTVWLPKGSRHTRHAPSLRECCFYDVDALYLKEDVAIEPSNERGVDQCGVLHVHDNARQTIQLVSNGRMVTLVARLEQHNANDFD